MADSLLNIAEDWPYFDRLSFQFQQYFRKLIRRGLKFLVLADVPDLFIYMTLVLTHGPYVEYAYNKLLSTRDARSRLRQCIIDVLANFLEEERIGAFALILPDVLYFIPRIREVDEDRMHASHVIFKIFKEFEAVGFTRQELITIAEENGYTFDMDALNRLVELNCVRREIVNHQPTYTINLYFDI